MAVKSSRGQGRRFTLGLSHYLCILVGMRTSLYGKRSSSLKAVPTRRLTWGGFSPADSGYSFGSRPVISCERHVSRSTRSISLQTHKGTHLYPFKWGWGREKKRRKKAAAAALSKEEKNWLFTASLRQTFFSSFIFWAKMSWMSFSFFFNSAIFSFFWSSLISESAEPVNETPLLLPGWHSICPVPVTAFVCWRSRWCDSRKPVCLYERCLFVNYYGNGFQWSSLWDIQITRKYWAIFQVLFYQVVKWRAINTSVTAQ